MPKLDGRQVLEQICSIHELRNIRVVVLTTSSQEEDITRSYDLGVHSYITKPVDLDQFFHVIRTLEEYWFQIVVLPTKDDE
jgi:CheY-like chemotaxis protein